jgi:AraC family transcriptional regulator, ethanolamine operon transcriptional activator
MMSEASSTCNFLEINSVDEYLKHLSTLFSEKLEYKILSESPFEFSCKFLKFEDIEIIKRKTSFSSFFKVKHSENLILFDFPIDDESFIYNGALCDSKNQLCCAKRTQISGIFPKGERFILSIAEKKLEEYIFNKHNCALSINIIEQNFNKYEVSLEDKNKLTRLLLKEFNKIEEKYKCGEINQSFINKMEDNILSALSTYIVNQQNNGKYINTKNRDRVLFRALEYISESDLSRLTLPELEENIHASVRTIEYTFKTRLGISPKKYITITRLNRVRRELLLADADEVSINDIINKYNIVNKGRFNTDYYSFFKEFPIETLNKNI